jgi:hypothetical protein
MSAAGFCVSAAIGLEGPGQLDTVGESVPGTRKMRIERDAALEMEAGPPKSACRSRLQTAVSCVG